RRDIPHFSLNIGDQFLRRLKAGRKPTRNRELLRCSESSNHSSMRRNNSVKVFQEFFEGRIYSFEPPASPYCLVEVVNGRPYQCVNRSGDTFVCKVKQEVLNVWIRNLIATKDNRMVMPPFFEMSEQTAPIFLIFSVFLTSQNERQFWVIY